MPAWEGRPPAEAERRRRLRETSGMSPAFLFWTRARCQLRCHDMGAHGTPANGRCPFHYPGL
jgi:hypothetical protein